MDKLLPMPKKRWAGHWIKLWAECIGVRWDMVVDLRLSAVAYLLLAKERHSLSRGGERVHRVRQIADVFNLPEPPMPRLWTSPKHQSAASSLLPSDGPILGIGPTTNWRAKTWRGDNFVELVERLTGPRGILPGARVAIFGAPDEREVALPVIEAIDPRRVIDLVGKVDLLTAYACLERCRFYVGNDSALMHLAAASGIPTLGLFGPSDETFYAPWGWLTTAVRTPLSFTEIFPENFDHRASDTLMDTLTVDQAEAAARALWDHGKVQAA